VSRNQNGGTIITVSNTTSGNNSQSGLVITSDSLSGNGYFAKYSSAKTAYKIVNASDFYLINDTAGDISILNDWSSGKIKFSGGASSTAQMTLTAAGRLLLGTTTEGTFLLDVNGTARVSDNLTVSRNQNAVTRVDLINTTSGTGSYTEYRMQSSSGTASLGKYSATTTAYKFINANDTFLFNSLNNGDIAILNDNASGNIKFAAGGSSTAHMTIKSNGRINMSSLPTSSAGLSSGDLWNNLGILSIA
jgi:hypothetical protein